MEPDGTSIARQRFGTQVSAATNTQATTEGLLGTMLSIRSVQRSYKEEFSCVSAVSDLRLPFSSPPTTRRVTVEVFDPASRQSQCNFDFDFDFDFDFEYPQSSFGVPSEQFV
jgi:hypothetical protein